MQTTKSMRVVSVFDPAIDHARTGKAKLEEYATTRDISKLTFIEGRSPTYFLVRRIPVHTLTRFVEIAPSLGEQRERAFMCGVELIENMYTPEGQLTQPRAPGRKVEHATGETYWWSESEIEALVDDGLLDRPTLVEIGGAALTRAGLRRGSANQFRLPHTLAEEWDALVSHLVDTPSPSSAAPSSGEQG